MRINIGKDEVGGSNPPSSSQKHLKSSDLHFFVWVKMWVNCLTHTVTHLPKGNNGDKSTGQEGCASCPAFSDLGLHNICSMKAPIVAAASSCFCRVAWV